MPKDFEIVEEKNLDEMTLDEKVNIMFTKLDRVEKNVESVFDGINFGKKIAIGAFTIIGFLGTVGSAVAWAFSHIKLKL